MRKLSEKSIATFQGTIYDYYKIDGRTFPWRNETNPYFILISEIMLQQTQVQRALDKYYEFITNFPTVKSLSDATLKDVLKHWQGLGYNRRGKYLYETARIIYNVWAGIVPPDPKELEKLPGIGAATAGAIVTYAYNKPVAFIETNIRTVYLHFFFKDAENVPDACILPLIERTMDRNNPRVWFYALTDYGVMLKKQLKFQNTQSRHYQKQSRFHGSNREVRGAILKMLSHADTGKPIHELYERLSFDRNRIDPAIMSLVRDNLLGQDRSGTYRIAS